MILTISGYPGSGKSSVAKKLASALGLTYVSIGSLLRKMSLETHQSLLEISEKAERDKSIDNYLDSHLRQLSNDDNLVVDARLGFYFIPKSVKIFFVVNLLEAARRVHKSNRKTESKFFPLLLFELFRRRLSEFRRYWNYYHVSLNDFDNYDLVVDTSLLNEEEVLSLLLSFLVDRGVVDEL